MPSVKLTICLPEDLAAQVAERAKTANVPPRTWLFHAITSVVLGTPLAPTERPSGLAAASEATREKVAKAGVRGQKKSRKKNRMKA